MHFLSLIFVSSILVGLVAVGAHAFSSSPKEMVWVAMPDDSKQCEKNTGKTLESASQGLSVAGVKVYDQKKMTDGKMHMQMCGSDTGMLNSFQISKADLKKASGLGYKLAKKK